MTIAVGFKFVVMCVRFLRVDWQKMVDQAMLVAEAGEPKLSGTETDDPMVLEAHGRDAMYTTAPSPAINEAPHHTTVI
ncbi:hypothetical protein SDRG_04756 [Saprolegnia diclina VS20]|uniref:Uncharacterized protein n=1 Tax=Saprolegnia diclina (strain VS20) TaxID=1156394 RepID=T0QI98_SAPDV|nr:hypothetical protein SDRG_04756 [Saprolegnia diclina VS20]EQC37729.1 hypothetical protein SDRG_04756 [Saprolegnia diclina VS20]|eukprot:XP_008608662.1 hypothetical protein SDRG_04756 [Saprolegnia diclina VS20]